MNKTALAALALLAASSALAGTNLVTNGDFEYTYSQNAWNYDQLSSGWTYDQPYSLYGWTNTTVGAAFEVQLATNFQSVSSGFASSYNGTRQYLELNSTMASGITQTLTTTANQWYTLSFGYADRAEDGGTNLASSVEVYWNGKLIDTITTSNTSWTTYSYTVEALTANTALSFVSTGPSSTSTYGSYLDGVSVTAVAAPVPEPESYAMLLAGLGLMATVARRRGKAARS